MWNNLRHGIVRSRAAILGWGLGLALYCSLMVRFFETVMDMRAEFEDLVAGYPEAVMAMVGGTAFFSPEGFVHGYFFSYMPLILGVFAVMAGAGLLVADEEQGVLDLILGHPISRVRLILARTLALAVTLLLILTISWLGLVAGSQLTAGLDFSLLQLTLPFLSLFGLMFFFGTLALLLSMLLPSRSLAAALSGGLLVAGFFLTLMGNMDDSLGALVNLSPLTYYQGGWALTSMRWDWLAGLLIVSVIFALLALWRFQHRQIRVVGSQGWQLPRPFASRS